jgi:hypothetical protein
MNKALTATNIKANEHSTVVGVPSNGAANDLRDHAIAIAQSAKKLNDLKALQKRTLTKLYNAKPAWLCTAHQQLDLAVASVYSWANYRADMPDDEILKRLLALNLARSITA